jgi:hypothetical protein
MQLFQVARRGWEYFIGSSTLGTWAAIRFSLAAPRALTQIQNAKPIF